MDQLQPSWQSADRGIESRVAFIRSVYAWLMAGFGVALLGAFLSRFTVAPLISLTGRYFIWVLFFVQMGSIFFATAVSRKKPLNMVAYALFTFVSGTIAGVLSLVVARGSGAGTVMLALGLTALVFLVLTAVAFVTKKDFSFLRSFVLVGLAVMFFGSLAAAIFNLPTFSLVVSGVAVIACSGKLLWDTSDLLRTGDFSNPAGAALSLFVSLYNIFIALLNILGRRR